LAAPFISYAQNAEDVVLYRALKHSTSRFYIDAGAGHPENDSVTKAFYDRDWRGINVEPDEHLHRELARERPRDVNLPVGLAAIPGRLVFHQSGAFPGASTFGALHGPMLHDQTIVDREVEVTTLALACSRFDVGDVDFLKIDVEGLEREVLLGADFGRWRPRIVVVEATLPHSSEPVHKLWECLLVERGYGFALFDGLNRFYVRHEDRALRDVLAVPANPHDKFVRSDYWHQVQRCRELEANTLSLADHVRRTSDEVTRYVASLRETVERSQAWARSLEQARDNELREALRYAASLRDALQNSESRVCELQNLLEGRHREQTGHR
jgi:FkbM family methyltransferase